MNQSGIKKRQFQGECSISVMLLLSQIKDIIQQGIEVPEQQNDLRRQQLRELALLNGTLRENDGLAKLKQLQEAQTIITNQIFCVKCGGAGHISSDCKQARYVCVLIE